MNYADLEVCKATGHTPLLDATWTLNRYDGGHDALEQNPTADPWAEWECIAPACHVLVRAIVAPPDRAVQAATMWQETVVWHHRVSPTTPPREPSIVTLQYVKELFVGMAREATVVFPPHNEVPASDGSRVSMFTLLGIEGRIPRAVFALPRFFTFLPPLP